MTVLTGTHDYKKLGLERQKSYPLQGRDVIIKKGAWIAANVTIIGPCTIGENAVVSAGCVVKQDIPANTLCIQENRLIFKKIGQEA